MCLQNKCMKQTAHTPTYLISDMAERKMAHIKSTKTVKYLKIYLTNLTESTERNPIKTHDPGFIPCSRIKRSNTVNMPLFYLKLTYTFTTRLRKFQVRLQRVLRILTRYLSSTFGRTDAWKHTRIFKAKPRRSGEELRKGKRGDPQAWNSPQTNSSHQRGEGNIWEEKFK